MSTDRSPTLRPGRVAHCVAALAAVLAVTACTNTADTSETPAASASSPAPSPSGTHDLSDAIPLPTTGSGPAATGTAAPDTAITPTAGPTGPLSTASATPSEQASIPDRRAEIVAPQDGETLTGDVTLTVKVSGFELVELTGEMREDRGHLWAFVDEQPPVERVRLPESESIVKSARPDIPLGELEPGEHTVTLVATHGYPVPFEPRVGDTVTFTVAE